MAQEAGRGDEPGAIHGGVGARWRHRRCHRAVDGSNGKRHAEQRRVHDLQGSVVANTVGFRPDEQRNHSLAS